MQYSIEKITTLIGARRIGQTDAQIGWLLTDSRSLCFPEETLFFALSSSRNDGHKYIPDLYRRGVRNFVVSMSPKLGDDRGLNKGMTDVSSDPQPPNLGGLDFIANGDRAVLRRVRHVQELYGFRFAEATMTFPDYDDYELTAMVILDSLTTEAPALTREQQEQLYNAVLEDYSDIPRKADRVEKLKNDRFYNALQVKFAYAVTCHKAQGGQWAHIYLDQGYMTDDMLTPDYIHWLYTAFTRATEKLYLVNWPKSQIEEG